jgi:hypothetical protein
MSTQVSLTNSPMPPAAATQVAMPTSTPNWMKPLAGASILSKYPPLETPANPHIAVPVVLSLPKPFVAGGPGDLEAVVTAIDNGDHRYALTSDMPVQTVIAANAAATQKPTPIRRAQVASLVPASAECTSVDKLARPNSPQPAALNQRIPPSVAIGSADVSRLISVNVAATTSPDAASGVVRGEHNSIPKPTRSVALPTLAAGETTGLVSNIATVGDHVKETALTGEIAELWSIHKGKSSSLRSSRLDLERLRDKLAERLTEYHTLLVGTGRNGKWMAFLREAKIPKSTAERYVAKWKLSTMPEPVNRPTGTIQTPSKEEIHLMVKKVKPKVGRYLTTPESVALFVAMLATSLEPSAATQ